MFDKNTAFYKKQTLNCAGRLLDLSSPKIMGILNVAPDSFYDGGKYSTEKEILDHAEEMLEEGADIIDVGGMSSRPGAQMIKEEEEIKRVIPVIKLLAAKIPDAIISVDTFRAGVARAAINEGASIINDISAGAFDKKLFETVARLNVPYILMHMKGTPANMQKNPQYENVMQEVMDFFVEKLSLLRQSGVKDMVIDPGFGFGKSQEHNYNILKNLQDFKIFGLPMMAGISRKSMICKVLKVNADKALNGTTALHSIALLNGADILRVHDVKEAREVIKLVNNFQNANG